MLFKGFRQFAGCAVQHLRRASVKSFPRGERPHLKLPETISSVYRTVSFFQSNYGTAHMPLKRIQEPRKASCLAAIPESSPPCSRPLYLGRRVQPYGATKCRLSADLIHHTHVQQMNVLPTASLIQKYQTCFRSVPIVCRFVIESRVRCAGGRSAAFDTLFIISSFFPQ